MKGFIEKVLMLIWILVPVLIIIGFQRGNLIGLVDGSAQLDAKYGATEIANAISVLQSAQDGVEHRLSLPATNLQACVKIYPTYVEVSSGLYSGRMSESDLVERAAFSADLYREGLTDGEAITIDCTPNKQLLLRKESGKIRVSS